MKIFSNVIENRGREIYCSSWIDDKELESLKSFLEIAERNHYLPKVIKLNYDIYVLTFELPELYEIIDNTVNINDDELYVLNKFKVGGFDIFETILDYLFEIFVRFEENHVFTFKPIIIEPVREQLKDIICVLFSENLVKELYG